MASIASTSMKPRSALPRGDGVYVGVGVVLALLMQGIGWGVATALRAGHFQHTALSYLMVFGALLLAYWLHWIAWFAVLAFRADMSSLDALYLLFPPALIESIGMVYDQGTWSIKGATVSGIPLAITWLIEAGIFFGVGFVSALGTIGSGTYCERCKAWCTTLTERRIAYDDGGTVPEALNQRQDWSALLRPEPAAGESFWYSVVIDQCPSCRETGTLTLSAMQVTVDAKGNHDTKSTVEVDRVYIASADVARLMQS